jgi:tRNA(Ile)-lysidine synthetase-like protein
VLDRSTAEALAAKLALPLVVEEVRVEPEGGIEAGARRARYAALQALARARGCRFVVVAHTRTDQAETVLMRMLRGSGLKGLAAMATVRRLGPGVLLARPLLGLSRREVHRYVEWTQLPFFEDPTNRELRFLRNALRHEVWPALERLSPSLEVRLAGLAESCREDEATLSALARAAQVGLLRAEGDQFVLPRRSVAALPESVARRLLRDVLHRLRPKASLAAVHLRGLLVLIRSGKGAELHLPGDLRAEVRRGSLRIGPRPSRSSHGQRGSEGGID